MCGCDSDGVSLLAVASVLHVRVVMMVISEGSCADVGKKPKLV